MENSRPGMIEAAERAQDPGAEMNTANGIAKSARENWI
jgi:hypothetical protein